VVVDAAAPRPPVLVEIDVTEDPSADRWHVTYHLAKPVIGLRFERGHDRFRTKSWTTTTDLAWRDAVGDEVVWAERPFQELTLSFPTSTGQRGYWLNVKFSDGGRLLFTGDFAVKLMTCSDSAAPIARMSGSIVARELGAEHDAGPMPDARGCDPTSAITSSVSKEDVRFTFRTTKTRHVQVQSERAVGELVWSPPSRPSDGTYVYFGDLEAHETPFGRAIIDPALPAWMLDAATTNVPKMLDWFEKETLVPLPKKPFVFLSFEPPGEGTSVKGGGLPGVVQLAASGIGWKNDGADERSEWLEFLAHETFHIWNGDLFHSTDEWLPEGSSEYVARRALLDLGLIDSARFRRDVLRAANSCMTTLESVPLDRAPHDNRPQYPCGATLLAWADVIARDHRSTVAAILGRTFTSRGDGWYCGDVFLRELAKIEPNAARLEPFDRVLHRGVADHADELFRRMLSRPDFPVTLGPAADGDLDTRTAHARVGVALAHCDCDHRVNLWTRDTGTDFGDSPECPHLRNVRVVAVEGHAIPAEAMAAYRAILERRAGSPLVLKVDGRSAPLNLTCRKDAPLPPFQKLLR
jgi:hypothetical protein